MPLVSKRLMRETIIGAIEHARSKGWRVIPNEWVCQFGADQPACCALTAALVSAGWQFRDLEDICRVQTGLGSEVAQEFHVSHAWVDSFVAGFDKTRRTEFEIPRNFDEDAYDLGVEIREYVEQTDLEVAFFFA